MKHLKLALLILTCCATLCVAASAADAVVYVKDGGTGDGTSALQPVGTLNAAYTALGTNGGTIVVVGKVSLDDDFVEPTHSGKVTVTQVYGTDDYRTGSDYGILAVGSRYILNGPTTFTNMAFRAPKTVTYQHLLIVAQFNDIVMDTGVECLNYGSYSAIAQGVSILGGVQNGADKYNTVATDLDSHITIKSGKFILCGFSRQVDKDFEGMAHIDISGGTIHHIYPGSANSGTGGDVDLKITGGTFVGKIITGTASYVKGKLKIKITGGDFDNFVSADGTVVSGGTSILDLSEYEPSSKRAALAAKAKNFTTIATEPGQITTGEPNEDFLYGTFTASNGVKLPYRYYLPKDYNTSVKSYPVFLYMHGNGSRGSNNTTQLTTNGAALNNAVYNSKYDCIMIAPQCARSPREWVSNYAGSTAFVNELNTGVYANGDYLNAAIELLDYFLNTYRVDTTRIYVTGSSNGGGATWSMTARFPYVFAAAVPLAGCEFSDGAAAIASRYVHQNIWTFHGDKDQTLPVAATQGMVQAIKNAGGTKIKYTEIKDGGHNIWSEAASTAGLVDWIFSKTNSSFDNTLRGTRTALTNPAGLKWNGSTATFNDVDGAKAYRMTVYVDGVAKKIYELETTSKAIDIASFGTGKITFGVTALASDLSRYVNSAEARSAMYVDPSIAEQDYNNDGEVTFADALQMLQDGVNNGKMNLVGVLRILKYLAAH